MQWNRSLGTRSFATPYQRILTRHCVALVVLLGAATAYATPVHLRTNQRVDPLGIDTMHPSLSWQSDSTTRNWKQSAYQILVATSADALRHGHADTWDSGRQSSSDSVDIPYSGPALKSHRQYFWTVRVWDEKGTPANADRPASWEMGLLAPSDWQAKWIRRSDASQQALLRKINWLWLPGTDAQHAPENSEVEFRYTLHLSERPTASTMNIFAAGTYTAQVNDIVTGHKEEWGAFDYEDIRDQLHYGQGTAGDNIILIRLSVSRSTTPDKTSPAALAAVLHLRDAKGEDKWLVSDSNWQVRPVKPQPATEWSAAQLVGPLPDHHFGVSTDRVSPAPTPDRIETGASLFRKDFSTHGPVISARLYVTALGSYQAYLNGSAVGQSLLTPEFTDYRKRALYQTYDVTTLLKHGENTLAAVLGAGWHGSPLLWSGSRLFPGPDRLRAQLELTYTDGKQQIIASDSTWQTAASPILSSEIYGGENYDARLDQSGWNAPGFRPAQSWSSPTVDSGPDIAVTAQSDTPVHRERTLAPVSLSTTGTGASQVTLFDMGQNMVGTVRLRVRGSRGTTVRLRFAERLKPDGTIYTDNLRDADATDRYTLSGQGEEDWTPAFTFHGFRYVEVSGYPGTPTVASIQGQVLNSLPPSPSMRLQTSSDLLNRMSELGLWGQRGNFLSIPTDCPQRDERLGWMGDAGVFWRTGSFNYDIDAFSHKFMQDIVDAQSTDGAFSNISPNLLQDQESHPGAPGWGDAGILVPYATWMQYGDTSLLSQNWASMEHWMEFIHSTNPNFLRQKELGSNYADWLAPDPHTPSDLVATAYWALIARQMQTMASTLGRTEDAAKYATLYTNIRSAYQKQYIHADGSVAGNTQTGYILTLYTDLAPKEVEAAMTDRLVKDIEAHQTHLTTGFLGTPFLLSVLDEHGRSDVAYRLLLNKTYPSWGYMVEKGATTWWERWNGDTGDPSMNSYNHYAFGSVMAWVYRRVAGIDTDATGPGFRHIVLSPHADPSLSHVHAEYDSVYGTIQTDWSTNQQGNLLFTVKLPANTTATLHLPATSANVIALQDGKPASMTYDNGSFTSEIGSGSYNFQLLKP